MRPVAFISILTMLLAGCGDFSGGEGRLVAQGRPIYYGEVDDDPAHMAVVALTNGPRTGYFCTGTLISSSYVLTAGHCLEGVSARNLEVFFGDDAYSTGTYREAAEVAAHPNYDGRNILNDIGMIRLASPAPTSVTPIPYLPARLGLTRSDEGAIVDFSGFGVTENRTDGEKLHVERPIERVCTGPSSCSEIVPHAFGYSQSGGGPCSGDSGGPAFLFRSGTEYVAGVTSYGDPYCTDFGVSTTVSDFEPFISDFIGGVLGAPCGGASECLSGYCVDGVCCDSPCSGVCQACNLSGTGTCQNVPNGTPCPDSDLCDGQETCQTGQCLEGSPLDCTNSNRCTVDRCEPAVGCIHDPLPDGTSCSDQNPCNGEETCLHGNCAMGTPLDCDDHNLCTQDDCDPLSGCRHTNLPDGTDCGGGPCGPATCKTGECIAGDPTICDDQNPCTKDYCDPQTGCGYEDLPDGWECGKCMMCMSSQCVEIEDCETDGGCGCNGTGGSAQGSILFLAALLMLVRRNHKILCVDSQRQE
jgi:hypothetical protein